MAEKADTGIEPQGTEEAPTGDDSTFVKECQDRAKLAVDGWNHNHKKWRDDVDFVGGKQWPDDVRQKREADERVILTINQLPKYSRQVTGDGKQNRISINVAPIESDRGMKLSNMAGTKDYSYAEIMQGIVRNIEAVSKASQAYDMALKHCVDGGFGWLRVMKRYAQPNGFEQELVIRGVRNPFSVLVDPQAMLSDEPNLSAMNYAFVHALVPRREAEKKYGSGITDVTIGDDWTDSQRWWYDADDIRLAEYYYIELKDMLYVLLSDGSIMEAPDLEDAKAQVAEKEGIDILKDRKGEKQCVYWALMHGAGIAEGPFKWDGGMIPIAPVLGPELFLVEGVEYQSLFRHSHDAQRMYNYWRSAATEAVALAPKVPWIADSASIAQHRDAYDRASSEPVNLLEYDYRENVPAPKRADMSSNPAAEINQSLQANDDVKNTIGIFDASLGQRSNEVSGKAIIARQQEGDTGTFEWHDALANAVERIGKIVVDLVPKIYDTDRIVRLRLPEEGEDFVRINYEVKSDEPTADGEPKLVKADLSQQRYDVSVKTGPSMGTQRERAAESMMAFMQHVPEAARAIADKVAANMDWLGADEIAERLRKIIPPELLTAAEREEMQQDQPELTPEQQQAQEAERAAIEAEREATRMEAEAKLIAAEADKIEAQAKMLEAQNEHPEKIKDMVAEAIAELIQSGALTQIQQNSPESPIAQ